MRDIDIKTLRLLVAVCDLQNIKRAAVQEHIEPSAISKRIAQLEAALGTPLLVRSRRGVQPTPAPTPTPTPPLTPPSQAKPPPALTQLQASVAACTRRTRS